MLEQVIDFINPIDPQTLEVSLLEKPFREGIFEALVKLAEGSTFDELPEGTEFSKHFISNLNLLNSYLLTSDNDNFLALSAKLSRLQVLAEDRITNPIKEKKSEKPRDQGAENAAPNPLLSDRPRPIKQKPPKRMFYTSSERLPEKEVTERKEEKKKEKTPVQSSASRIMSALNGKNKQPEKGLSKKEEKAEAKEKTDYLFVSDAADQQIQYHSQLANFHTAEKKEQPVLNTKIPTNASNKEALAQFAENMRLLTALQYPSPAWEYQYIPASKPGEKNIEKVRYDPSAKVTNDMVSEQLRNSLALRKLSLIGGCLNRLDDPDFLTKDKQKKQIIKARLIRMANDIVENKDRDKGYKDPKKAIDEFSDKLIDELYVQSAKSDKKISKKAKLAEKDKITTQVRKAERYFTADYNKNLALIFFTQDGERSNVQIDINLNHQLTLSQKLNYASIHSSNPPAWFSDLEPWEQSWYLEQVPKKLSDDGWENFENLFKSSAMQHTPGTANMRINYLLDDKGNIITTSINNASPVPFEMEYEARQTQAEANVEQLSQIANTMGAQNFDQLWGNFFDERKMERPPNLVLVQSLLSPKFTAVGKTIQADEKLIRQQEAAIENADIHDEHHLLLYHNDGTNALSHGSYEKDISKDPQITELSTRSKKFIENILQNSDMDPDDVTKIMNLLKSPTGLSNKKLLKSHYLDRIDNLKSLSEEQKFSLKLMISVNNELNILKNKSSHALSRNREEYIIALKKMLVENMGGVVTKNCKSGKDRTGQSELYQHALTLIARLSGGLIPGFYEKAEKGSLRKLFNTIHARLIASQKSIHAGQNCQPGAFGNKAEEAKFVSVAWIVDQETLDELKAETTANYHAMHCASAGTNKPDALVRNEAEESRKLAKKDKAYIHDESSSASDSASASASASEYEEDEEDDMYDDKSSRFEF